MTEYVVTAMKAPFAWARKLYDWTLQWSQSRKAPYALFGIAFAESSFFPIPPDALLIPMVVADRARWLRFALICTLGSVAGGVFGYLIGRGLYEAVGKPLVALYDMQQAVTLVGQKYADNAFLTVFTAAFTPIPYKAITITAGLFKIALPTLIIASVIGRAGRFFLVAGALRLFGERIRNSIERYFDIFSMVFLALLVGGFVVFKFVLK